MESRATSLAIKSLCSQRIQCSLQDVSYRELIILQYAMFTPTLNVSQKHSNFFPAIDTRPHGVGHGRIWNDDYGNNHYYR